MDVITFFNQLCINSPEVAFQRIDNMRQRWTKFGNLTTKELAALERDAEMAHLPFPAELRARVVVTRAVEPEPEPTPPPEPPAPSVSPADRIMGVGNEFFRERPSAGLGTSYDITTRKRT